MAPHWFKGSFMQLLALVQTLVAAYNCSNVAPTGAEEETAPPPQHIHILPSLIPDPHISSKTQLTSLMNE